MQLPRESLNYSARVRYGTYVARRLRRAKLPMAADVAAATAEVRAKGRARDDAEDTIQECLADRDAADALLDTTAATVRATLAGRSPRATKEAPYTQIFPDGSDYYTAAPLNLCVPRYLELIDRLQKYLPADDACLEHISTLKEGVTLFQEGVAALDAARRAKGLLATDLDAAEDAWERLLQRTYGALIQRFGKGAFVEAFFPKLRRASDADADAAE